MATQKISFKGYIVQPSRHDYSGEAFKHVNITVMVGDGKNTNRKELFTYTWQTDRHSEMWYGRHIEVTRATFPETVIEAGRLAGRIDKLVKGYDMSPLAIIEALKSIKAEEVVYDGRLSGDYWVALNKVMPANIYAWRDDQSRVGGLTCYTRVFAENKEEATLKVMASLAEQASTNAQTADYLERWLQVGKPVLDIANDVPDLTPLAEKVTRELYKLPEKVVELIA